MKSFNRVIYPGTFDPITNGHLDIIKRASNMFDEVVVAIAVSRTKKPYFSLEKRIEMAESATSHISNTKVVGFDNLLVNLCDEVGSNIIIRGLRAVSDFEYELQMGYANASLKKELETIYLMPNLEHAFISSSVVRSILEFDGRIEHLVPESVHQIIKESC